MGSRLILITSIIVLIALILNIGKIASIIGRVIKTLMPAAIEITGCTTISVEGEYVLTTDIIDAQGTCIDIQANNVILDCQGHTIDGIGSGNGIYISRDHPTDTNITIKNCIITDWVNGIYFDNANNNTLSNITANYNDVFGIYISTSNNNTLSNITANNNNYDGIRLLESNYNVITNITASNNTYVGIRLAWSSNNILSDIIANYNKERGINLDFGGNENNTLTNLTLISNYFGILFYNSTYNRIVNATISLSSSDAISLTENSNYNNITGSVIRDGTSVYGTGAIVVARSSYNLIEGNYLINNTIGVLLFSNATNNWVKNNTILNHTRTIPCGFSQSPCIDIPACGIIISNLSANNIISGNLIQGNGAEASETNPLQIAGGIMIGGATVLGGPAIGIYGSNDNLFYDNKLIGNIPAGVGIDDSSGNIFWNNILNNTLNINFAGPIYENYWNTTAQPGQRIYSPGYMIGGNYWTNPNGNGYSDICEDSDKDGFCDDPYILNNNNIDYLPLSDEYVYGDVTPPTYSNYGHNSTIAGQPVTFYILFNDNIALHPNGQWIFSTNNSGVWINDTPINFTTTPSWANVTKILNSTPGIVIGYRWYAKDNSGNINNTPIFTLTTTPPPDTTPPTYSNNSTNSTLAGAAISHILYWQDNIGLSGYIFSFDNCTGNFVNDSWVSWTGNPLTAWSNVTKIVNSTVGCTIRWKVYANDTSNNWNSSLIYSYITTSPEAPPAGPGPGGGAGPGIAPPPSISVTTETGRAVISLSNLPAGQTFNISTTEPTLPIAQINFTTKNAISSAQINISVISLPASLPDLPNTYKYLLITISNITSDNIENIRIAFMVEKTWLITNNIDPETVAAYRYVGTWTKLPTTKVSEDSEHIYYISETPGFSYFAIAGETISCRCSDWEDAGCGISPCLANEMKQTRACTPAGCDIESRCISHPSCAPAPTVIRVYWIVILVTVAIVIVILAIIAKQKKK